MPKYRLTFVDGADVELEATGFDTTEDQSIVVFRNGQTITACAPVKTLALVQEVAA